MVNGEMQISLKVSGVQCSLYMANLHFVFSLQKRASHIEITPFGEEETLYGPAGTCTWMFWVWMCTILLHKHHQFWFFFFFVLCCHCGHQSVRSEFGHNLTGIQSSSSSLINKGYSDYINKTNFWFLH